MRPILALLVAVACTSVAVACGDDEMDRASGDAEQGGAGTEEEAGPEEESGATVPEGGAEGAEDGGAGDAGTSPAGSAQGALVKLRDSQLGPVLFSGSDRALYLFTRDPERVSRCHGECAVAWPPFFAEGRPRAGGGVKRSLLGTIRRGGRRQVTYAGQPLYFYVDDPKGEVLCNNIVEFGGTWFALTAEGEAPAA